MLSVEDTKELLSEAESLKWVVFFGISVSTVATLTSIIAVPMLYNYMQYVQSNLQDEIDFCRHRTDDLWEEYAQVTSLKKMHHDINEFSLSYA